MKVRGLGGSPWKFPFLVFCSSAAFINTQKLFYIKEIKAFITFLTEPLPPLKNVVTPKYPPLTTNTPASWQSQSLYYEDVFTLRFSDNESCDDNRELL